MTFTRNLTQMFRKKQVSVLAGTWQKLEASTCSAPLTGDRFGSPGDSVRTAMPLSEFKTSAEVIAEDLASDPDFRAAWEHRAFARTISLLVLRHRTDSCLSQTGLAKRIGMSQQRIARLELGEDNPTIDTLMQLPSGLGVEFTIHIRANMPPDLVATGA